MTALSMIRQTDTGQLIIDLPKEFIGKTLRLVVMPAEEWMEVAEKDEAIYTTNISTVEELPERYHVAQQFKGDAPFPDYPMDKYSVYEQ